MTIADADTATAVLAAAKEHGVFRQEMPEDDETRIIKADQILRQAQAAYAANVRLAPVLAVLGAAGALTDENVAVNGDSRAPAEQSDQTPEGEIEPGAEVALEPAKEIVPDEPAPAPTPEAAHPDAGQPQAAQSAVERGGFNAQALENVAWECPHCDYACRTERGLKRHITKAGHDTSRSAAASEQGTQTTVEEQILDVTRENVVTPEPEAPQVDGDVMPSGHVLPTEPPVPGTASAREAIAYVHTERAMERIGEMKLPVPQEFDATPPQRPVDMSKLSTDELRTLFSAFNACSAYARWHAAIEGAKGDDCKRVVAQRKRQTMDRLNPLDAKGKPKPVTMLENEAFNTSSELREWAERQAEHVTAAKLLDAMVESYDLDCARISRDLAARATELQHS